jgi:hypothetical protein
LDTVMEGLMRDQAGIALHDHFVYVVKPGTRAALPQMQTQGAGTVSPEGRGKEVRRASRRIGWLRCNALSCEQRWRP